MNKTVENMEIKIASSDQEYADMVKIRTAVFVEEQNIPSEQEFDGNDHSSSHVVAYVREENNSLKPVGTMRIRYFSDFVKFERMAVLQSYRKTDVADKIMSKGMNFAARKGYKNVYGMCKKELLPRWQKVGYEEVAGAEHVVQNGMELIPIRLKLPADPKAIKMTDHPSILTAVEDKWDMVELPPEKPNSKKISALFWRIGQKKRKR